MRNCQSPYDQAKALKNSGGVADSNEPWLSCRAQGNSRVHIENGRAVTAPRPCHQIGIGGEIKRLLERPVDVQFKVRARLADKVEVVRDGGGAAGEDLSVADGVGGQDRETDVCSMDEHQT